VARDHAQVLPPQQLRDARGDEPVARAVVSPGAHEALLGPLERHRIEPVALGDRAVEVGLEGGDQGDLRQFLVEQAHGADIGRIVGRGDPGHFFHGVEHLGGDPLHPVHPAPEHRLEADRRHLGGVLDAAGLRVGELGQALAHGLGMVGHADSLLDPLAADRGRAAALRRADPLDAAAGQLPLALHVDELVLEARRPQVRNEDLHGVLLPTFRARSPQGGLRPPLRPGGRGPPCALRVHRRTGVHPGG